MGTRDKEKDLERLIPLPKSASSSSGGIVGISKSIPQINAPHESSSSSSFSVSSLTPSNSHEARIFESYSQLGMEKVHEWMVNGLSRKCRSLAIFTQRQSRLVQQYHQTTQAFKELAIIRHPRMGEYAFGFITSTVILRGNSGGEELCCVYVPTNHLYIGDIFLISSQDVLRPNLSVREGIEIVISGGMSVPQTLTTLDAESKVAMTQVATLLKESLRTSAGVEENWKHSQLVDN
ncbi:hypothetical protein ACFE04_001147 [Oxalis oulophora]